MSFTTAALVIAWLAIVVLAFGFAGLMAQLADLKRALGDGAAPSGQASAGGAVVGLALPATGDLATLRPAGGGVVAFVSPGCPSCEGVLADLAAAAPSGEVVVVSTGSCAEVPEALPARCLPQGGALLGALSVPATPYLLAVDAAGTITDSLLPMDPHDLEHWLTHTTAPKEARA